MKMNNNDSNKKYHICHLKTCFFSADNLLNIIVLIIGIGFIISTLFFTNKAIKDVFIGVGCSTVSSSFIVILLNAKKYINNKKSYQELSSAIFSDAEFLVKALNGYLIASGANPICDFTSVNAKNKIANINFNGFKTIYELFAIIFFEAKAIYECEFVYAKNASDALIVFAYTNAMTTNPDFNVLFENLRRTLLLIDQLDKKHEAIKLFNETVNQTTNNC